MSTHRIALLSCLAAFALSAGEAYGFCVYNQSSSKVLVKQQYMGNSVESGLFAATLAPGEKSCCHWTDKTCNFSAERRRPLPFKVDYTTYKTVPMSFNPALPPLDVKVETGTVSCGHYGGGDIAMVYVLSDGYMTIQDWTDKTPGKMARVVSWASNNAYTDIYYCPAD